MIIPTEDRRSKTSSRKSWIHILLAVGLTAGLHATSGGTSPEGQDAAARRRALLQLKGNESKVITRLASALQDKNPVVARTAARLLVRCGRPALPVLRQALHDDDMLIRRTVALGLGELGPEAVGLLARVLRDQDNLVRQAAVLSLGQVQPRSERVVALATRAWKDEDAAVSQTAQRVTQSFFTTVAQVRLPSDGWKFKRDRERVGRDQRWFAVDTDDSNWHDIGIEQAWQLFDYAYIGVAWYRRTLDLPDRPPPDRVELAFAGVDECAWVWMNAQYAGEHDIGPSGWDKAFRLEVTDLLRWGEPNQITVRAMNTAGHGGIWRPVTIMVMELAHQ